MKRKEHPMKSVTIQLLANNEDDWIRLVIKEGTRTVRDANYVNRRDALFVASKVVAALAEISP